MESKFPDLRFFRAQERSFSNPLEYCRAGEREISSKRKSEEPLNERPSKRSRTSLSPSNSCNLTVHCPSLSSDSSTKSSVRSEHSWFPSLSTSESVPKTKSSSKRKAPTDVTEESPRKRSRLTITAEDHLETSKGNRDISSAEISNSNTRAALQAKYTERDLLGKGGYGSVYDGYRNEDNLPVAIKHIPQKGVKRISIKEENIDSVPLEVVMMQKVQSGTPGTSAAVALLDWYDLEEELILILERPVPCMDLYDALTKGCRMTENGKKILTKQLVDALIEIHSRGVFHNDIKVDNILIEYGSAIPRVRLIDFGCGTFLTEGTYHSGQGTPDFSSPEWFITKSYRAEPATVWQLGVVVYAMVHGRYPFVTTAEIIKKELHVNGKLSNNCKDFLLKSLSKNPETRATLAALRDHPWLV
ncbi:serine/threonine-protein kinase pim-2-like isoform X1 [Xyrichtys novacula]|uniref:non-specific serine/threonine protein kinase n=1 Tax=Xyrichtys novacula TaxID=13765 RepID=A0AAV1G7E1_XYRNO|nr:serine/threonine-protein kinase pim-2-like isoform X1 [Xyrichtys novacula]